MSFYISIIGIDGSGKSTVTADLANLVSAEFGLATITVGDDCRGSTPHESLFCPGFRPDGDMWVTRLARLFRRSAKATNGHRRLYPLLKLIHLTLQEQTVRRFANTYQPDIIFGDGNLLLSSAGRAINYVEPSAFPALKVAPANPDRYLEALFDYIFLDKSLPQNRVRSLPGLKWMRGLYWLEQRLKLNLLRWPDAVIFLDVAPETALTRLKAKGKALDHHENLHDLSQAQVVYRGVADLFRRRRGEPNIAVIDVTLLSVDQTLERIIHFISTLPLHPKDSRDEAGPLRRLGTDGVALAKTSTVMKKVLNYRYLVRYVLPNLHRGSAHELTFPLSQLGRLLLREGYSAKMMQAIYLRNQQKNNFLDMLFLDYPLHRAIYHRLQILKPVIEAEFRNRGRQLPTGWTIKVMTAPSGYAFDLFQPLQRMAELGWAGVRSVHITASDLDPEGDIGSTLIQAAHEMNIRFDFVRGDLTTGELQATVKKSGPYDMILFVGLSSWIAKPHLINHLKLMRGRLLAPGGVLISDCFTAQPFALTGKYVGYQASYYTPQEFTTLLAYCGFDPANISWASGPEGINHVCVARLLPSREIELNPIAFTSQISAKIRS